MLGYKKKLIFILITLLVSIALRSYQLGNIPNGLTTDEADLGYNAFSILETGKDIYGRPYPFFFQALDDYKPGIAVYSTIPAIYFFGNNDFSIRLVPVLFGSALPILIFWLVGLLYPDKKKLPYIAAILVLCAPWSIQLSRAMLWYPEFLFFFLLFLIFFRQAVQRNGKYLIASAIFLSLTLYTYYAAAIYIIPTLLLVIFLYRFDLFKKAKYFFLFLIILFVLSLPAIKHYQSPVAKTRLNAISVFNPDITLPNSISAMTYDQDYNIPFGAFTHNRRFIFTSSLLENYTRYFNLDYLFINASSVRYFYVNYVGLFYLIELPLFLYGLYLLVKRRSTSDKLVLGLLLIAPLPAIITIGSGFVHRALVLLPAIQIIVAVGAGTLLTKWFPSRRILIILTSLVYTCFVLFFLHQYFIHSPREFNAESNNGAWFSTVKNVLPIINNEKSKYSKVIFSWSQAKLVPPIYFLFYNKIDPKIIQLKASQWTDEPPSYRQIYYQIQNIEFRPIDWKSDQNLKNSLFVGYTSDFPANAKNVIGKTFLPDGKEHFMIVGNR